MFLIVVFFCLTMKEVWKEKEKKSSLLNSLATASNANPQMINNVKWKLNKQELCKKIYISVFSIEKLQQRKWVTTSGQELLEGEEYLL